MSLIPLDLSSALSAFVEEVTITREEPGAYDSEGRWSPGAISTFDIDAAVQPVSGKELEILFSGTEVRETIKLYTTDELRASDAPLNTTPDKILWQTRQYEVKQVDDWASNGAYRKYLAVRVQQ